MERLQWTTTHNTAERTMTHVFDSGRIMVLTDYNSGKIYVQKDGKPLDCYEVADVSLDNYVDLLVNLAQEDKRLSGFVVD